MSRLLEKYSGRLVKLMGDGVLAEFASIVNAVQCAVEIQQGMEARNAALPEESAHAAADRRQSR